MLLLGSPGRKASSSPDVPAAGRSTAAQSPHPVSLGVSQSPVDSPGAGLRLLSSGLCLCLRHSPWEHPPGKRQACCCWFWPQWPWSPFQVRAADCRVKSLLPLRWQFLFTAETISLLKSSHIRILPLKLGGIFTMLKMKKNMT